MLHLLLLFYILAVARADCRGLNANLNFSNVCDPDGFRESAARIQTGQKECTYSNALTGTDCTGMKTKKEYDKMKTTCRINCPAVRETKLTLDGTRYIFQEYTYKENPCTNNTGLAAQSDISEFVCKDEDTGFLCKMHDTDNTKFYCGCKEAKDGIFTDTCTFVSDSTILTVVLIICGVILVCISWCVYNSKKDKLAPV